MIMFGASNVRIQDSIPPAQLKNPGLEPPIRSKVKTQTLLKSFPIFLNKGKFHEFKMDQIKSVL